MCVICTSEKGCPQPGSKLIRSMFRANPDGAGYMVALIPCTSDVDTAAENPNAAVGRILGHEGVGRIVSVGSEVKDFKPGDVVSFTSPMKWHTAWSAGTSK